MTGQFDPLTPAAPGGQHTAWSYYTTSRVLATDPESGETKAKQVSVLHHHQDTALADVTVKDAKTGKSTTIKATANHPFWNASTSQWSEAKDLKPGDKLRSPDGESTQTVTAIKVWTGLKWMDDLTVNDIHTYYVLAGTTPVLVHNCGGASPDYMDDAHNYTAGGHSVTYTQTATAVGSDSRTLRNLANVRNDGMHDVVAHGTRDGYVDLDGEITNGGQLVDAIRANPHYREGQPCRLMVCHSGVSGVGQQVADELNVPVLAPTDRVGTNPLHGPGQEPLVDNGGGWVTLRPRSR